MSHWGLKPQTSWSLGVCWQHVAKGLTPDFLNHWGGGDLNTQPHCQIFKPGISTSIHYSKAFHYCQTANLKRKLLQETCHFVWKRIYEYQFLLTAVCQTFDQLVNEYLISVMLYIGTVRVGWPVLINVWFYAKTKQYWHKKRSVLIQMQINIHFVCWFFLI